MNCFDKFVYFSKIYRHEWISVNETQYGGIKICDTQVFCVLTGFQRDPRVLGRHKASFHGSRYHLINSDFITPTLPPIDETDETMVDLVS